MSHLHSQGAEMGTQAAHLPVWCLTNVQWPRRTENLLVGAWAPPALPVLHPLRLLTLLERVAGGRWSKSTALQGTGRLNPSLCGEKTAARSTEALLDAGRAGCLGLVVCARPLASQRGRNGAELEEKLAGGGLGSPALALGLSSWVSSKQSEPSSLPCLHPQLLIRRVSCVSI